MRTGGLGGDKGLAQLGGWNGCGEGLAQPPPPTTPPIPSTATARNPCLSHLCARILGHRDSDAQLWAPKHQLQDEGAVVRGGAGGGGGATGGAGPGRWDKEARRTGWGAEKGAVLSFAPAPHTIETV